MREAEAWRLSEPEPALPRPLLSVAAAAAAAAAWLRACWWGDTGCR